jgi:DNA-binding MarR family transcriptional regulator
MSRRDAARPSPQGGNGPAAVAAALFGLAAAVVRRVPRDVSLTSMSTMSTLERSGPRRITDLAAVEGVTQPSMTALVNLLERAGLVERQGDPTDKRVALVVLSTKGQEFVRGRRQRGAEAFEQSIKKLTADETALLIAAIPALERLNELSELDESRGSSST